MIEPSIMAPNSSKLNEVEKDVKEKYLDIVRSLSYEELKKFNKFTYKNLVAEEMALILPDVNKKTIEDTAHYISNALNNEAQTQRGQKKRLYIHNTGNHVDKIVENVQEAAQKPNMLDETLDSTFSSSVLDETYEDSTADDQNNIDDSITEVKTAIKTRRSIVQNHTKLIKEQPTKNKATAKSKSNNAEKEEPICLDTCKKKQNGEMIRCNLCMLWFHTKCVNCDNSVGCWTCPGCRKMPEMVRMVYDLMRDMQESNHNISEQISTLSQNFENKLGLINDRITSLSNQEKCKNQEHCAQMNDIRDDISNLKQEVDKNVHTLMSKTQGIVDSVKVIKTNTEVSKPKQPLSKPQTTSGGKVQHIEKETDHKSTSSKPNTNNNSNSDQNSNPSIGKGVKGKSKLTLITGSSSLKGIDPRRLSQNVRVKTFYKATIETMTLALSKMDLTIYETVIIHVGSLDVVNHMAKDTFKAKYNELIELVSKSSKVIVSGLLPKENLNVSSYNQVLLDICKSQGISFVENHSSFILASGEIPKYLFHFDKIHLKPYGTAKLLSNINSKCTIFKDKSNETSQPFHYPNKNRWQNVQARSNHSRYQTWGHGRKKWGTRNNPIEIST